MGPQELANHNWLLVSGAGIEHPDPSYFNVWLTYQLNKGSLAEAIWNGFIKGIKTGTFNINDQMGASLKVFDFMKTSGQVNFSEGKFRTTHRVNKFAL